jgi:hypothetical protein
LSAETLFNGMLMAGFECATHRRGDGRRLDLLASTGHAAWAARDYAELGRLGIGCARDGLRWHLIETRPGIYDWSSFLPMLRAAREQRIQVVWDLCHYGYPDGLDIWRPEFVTRFARFAGAVAQLMKEEGCEQAFYSPINEISFWSWAGGDVAYFNPGAHGRGEELKQQLVRASIAAIEAIRRHLPAARFVQCDPLIQVTAGSTRPEDIERAEGSRLAQFDAFDLLTGRRWPGLGGAEHYLDIVGANFYPHNQWQLSGQRVFRGEPGYRPLAGMLAELYRRYQRPLLNAETGAEDSQRAPWLAYVSEQVAVARARGVPIEAICWYPFLDYPGWDDDRYCPAGALGAADGQGGRAPYHPLQVEMAALQARFAR